MPKAWKRICGWSSILLIASLTGCGNADKVAQQSDPPSTQGETKTDPPATTADTKTPSAAPEKPNTSDPSDPTVNPGSPKKSDPSDPATNPDAPKKGETPTKPENPNPVKPVDPIPENIVPADPDEARANEALPLRSRRLEVPPLNGGVAWINTAGPINMQDLRGKFVILDFWTYCCINCMHILPELKKLERKYPNELVVIGVHSKKFDTEEDSKNITEAVLRHEIEHPVVNDANHAIWGAFGVSSWPTVLLIDPQGYAVWGRPGEVKFEQIDELLQAAIPYYRKQKLLDDRPIRFDLEAHKARQTPLRFPGKVLADEAGNRLFIADSTHNRIVVSDLAGKLLYTMGTGAVGKQDGDFATAAFDKPQGMFLKEQTLYIADTENHLLRKADLEKKTVSTIAGLGFQARGPFQGLDPETLVGDPRKLPLNSPWDLFIHGEHLYIAMAGPHQIWRMTLDETKIGPFAGTGQEDIIDGSLLKPDIEPGKRYATFAQPSGLASDGKTLFVADSEGSSIRAVPFDLKQDVTTVIGTAHLPGGRLFEFGDVDGEQGNARLQHCLGVVWSREKLYITDTYNNKIKVIDPAAKPATVRTIAGTGEAGLDDKAPTFDEPAGLTAAGSKLYVADTNNHAIRVIDLDNNHAVSTLVIEGLTPPVVPLPEIDTKGPDAVPLELPAQQAQAVDGAVTIRVALVLPEGFKITPTAPMTYRLAVEGDAGVIDRAKLPAKAVKIAEPSAEIRFSIPLAAAAGRDTLVVSLTSYYCREGAEGVCRSTTNAWKVPIEISPDAKAKEISLDAEVK